MHVNHEEVRWGHGLRDLAYYCFFFSCGCMLHLIFFYLTMYIVLGFQFMLEMDFIELMLVD